MSDTWTDLKSSPPFYIHIDVCPSAQVPSVVIMSNELEVTCVLKTSQLASYLQALNGSLS